MSQPVTEHITALCNLALTETSYSALNRLVNLALTATSLLNTEWVSQLSTECVSEISADSNQSNNLALT